MDLKFNSIDKAFGIIKIRVIAFVDINIHISFIFNITYKGMRIFYSNIIIMPIIQWNNLKETFKQTNQFKLTEKYNMIQNT